MTLRVIGAALPRTGTVSLKVALERLCLGPCYHMSELILHPEGAPLWTAAAEGRPNWDVLLDGYRSTADFPACYFWRSLVDHYPAAKIILTTRDPESWVDSVLTTVGNPAHQTALIDSPLAPVLRAIHIEGVREQDRARMIEGFHAYQQAVRAALPADRLLVFSARDGWEPLCAFLGVPVPDEPYPNLNSRETLGDTLVNENGQAASFAELQGRIGAVISPPGTDQASGAASPLRG